MKTRTLRRVSRIERRGAVERLEQRQLLAAEIFSFGNLNQGVGVDDNATGDGYLMYSQANVFSRFATHPPIAGNSDHVIAVQFDQGNWRYNDNATWRAFSPAAKDRLIARVDFDTDQVSSLHGFAGQQDGIARGYFSSDAVFAVNIWNGLSNAGEFSVNGTQFTVDAIDPKASYVGSTRLGIAVDDAADGTGFVLFSEQSVHNRFAANPPLDSNSERLIAVRFDAGQWQYNDNVTWRPLVVNPSDRLIAAVDFTNDSITSLGGTESTIAGIRAGYVSGDLSFAANLWDGTSNPGEFSITGTSLVIPIEFQNDPPELIGGVTSLTPLGTFAGTVDTGTYLGRIPALTAIGDTLSFLITGGSLPMGAFSVDSSTGDLYVDDATLLPVTATSATIAFSVTGVEGQTTNGSIAIDLPTRAEYLNDALRDSGSHRRGITFDLRQTSVSAAGETLYTSIIKPNGTTLVPGDSFDDVDGGYHYGTYFAGLDGVLRYEPNATLYEDRYFEFSDFPGQSLPDVGGMTYLSRPERMLVLVAASGTAGAASASAAPASTTTYKPISRRNATPRLTNSQPVAIANGAVSIDDEIVTQFVAARKDDLIGINLAEFFVDPDGDQVIADQAFSTAPFGAAAGDVDVVINADKTQVWVDVTGTEFVFPFFQTIFDETVVTIYVSDNPNVNAGPGLIIPIRNYNDSIPVYEVPDGIKFLHQTDRNDLDSSQSRLFGSTEWQKRWANWKVASTTYAAGLDRRVAISAGDAMVDLASGNATAVQPLPLADAFDDVTVLLDGLVYDGGLVDNKSLAKVIIDKPVDETRDITQFTVTVTLADHFDNDAASPSTQTYVLPIAAAQQSLDRFELTVPILDSTDDTLDSGVFGYQLSFVPQFAEASTSPAEDPITIRTAGRVAVVKQTRIEPDDTLDYQSYSNFDPVFGDGWQLAGLPRLVLDRGNTRSGTFYSGVGITLEIAIPHAIIQFPGSDKLSVFRGSPTPSGQPYRLADTTNSVDFTPVDMDFGVVDVDNFGTLSINSSNVFTYVDGGGTEYQFSRFNAVELPLPGGGLTNRC